MKFFQGKKRFICDVVQYEIENDSKDGRMVKKRSVQDYQHTAYMPFGRHMRRFDQLFYLVVVFPKISYAVRNEVRTN